MLRLTIALTSILGCASAQDQIQVPVQRRCKGIGLVECGELTEGVLLYAEGDIERGRKKLWDAGSKNKSPDLRTFASSLVQLGTTPKAEEHAESLIDAANLLIVLAERPNPIELQPAAPLASAKAEGKKDDAGAAAGPGKPSERKKKERNTLVLLSADTDPSRMEGGIASPGASPAKVPCASPAGSSPAVCIKAMEGPFVVTDLIGLGGCPNDLFAAAGGSTSPRWILPSSSNAPLSVHGSRLVVKAGEFLFIGAHASKSEKVGTDNRCSILWSGFRPYGTGDDAGAVPRDLGF